MDCLETHLRQRNCPYANFVGEAIVLILHYNFCFFDGVIRQQHTGYATGSADGSETAHIYLEERLKPVFDRYAQWITFQHGWL
jgi:hypothetical protein